MAAPHFCFYEAFFGIRRYGEHYYTRNKTSYNLWLFDIIHWILLFTVISYLKMKMITGGITR